MDLFNGIGLRQNEKVVIALLMTCATDEPMTAKLVLIKAKALDLRTHGTIKHKDSLAGSLAQGLQYLAAIALSRPRTKKIVKHQRIPLA